ncbi:unnamed protein product [Prunus armeniaca]
MENDQKSSMEENEHENIASQSKKESIEKKRSYILTNNQRRDSGVPIDGVGGWQMKKARGDGDGRRGEEEGEPVFTLAGFHIR